MKSFLTLEVSQKKKKKNEKKNTQEIPEQNLVVYIYSSNLLNILLP